ncbi:hypothetical protein M885DRAFT_578254 [Pelagophyceae sp. CCMP2097]|nr:hypothetical protein M885DRAFT_578254 [Pelagophyceae sp. CCMP2097]
MVQRRKASALEKLAALKAVAARRRRAHLTAKMLRLPVVAKPRPSADAGTSSESKDDCVVDAFDGGAAEAAARPGRERRSSIGAARYVIDHAWAPRHRSFTPPGEPRSSPVGERSPSGGRSPAVAVRDCVEAARRSPVGGARNYIVECARRAKSRALDLHRPSISEAPDVSLLIDEVMQRFDFDKNGKLEASEVRAFLQALLHAAPAAHGSDFDEKHSFKLQSLKDAHRRGLIGEKSMRNKWQRITGTKPPRSGEARVAFEVSDGDVDFVMEQCDKNGDAALNSDEVSAAVAVWMQLVADEVRRGVAARDAEPASWRLLMPEPAAAAPTTAQPDGHERRRLPRTPPAECASSVCALM